MARLAIVSTYNENCGNASYTHVLKKAFSEFVEVDVIPLDLFLLQKKSAVFRKAGDEHIMAIANRLKTYDYVNIQFEAGLFGTTIPDILRRILILIDAAPNLILTMHRIDVGQMTSRQAWQDVIRMRSFKSWKKYTGGRKFSELYRAIILQCKFAAKKKNVWIKVHTKRERRVVTEIYQFSNCFDYPLAFLTEQERADAWAHDDRTAFLQKHGFQPEDVVVGLFGYISEYKGMETAIQAMGELPEHYKLAIFGSHHPQSVRPHTALHPYIESLLDLMDDVDLENYETLVKDAKLKKLRAPQFRIESNGDETEAAPKRIAPTLKERVRFIGSLPDPEFIEALRLTDAVVLPYIEVGQSMSGVLVLGMEAGARMICANNHSFSETRKYFGDVTTGFDIGNHVELAQKVVACKKFPERSEYREAREGAYLKYNIRDSISVQLSKFGHQGI